MSDELKEEKKPKNYERLERIRNDLAKLRNEIATLRREDKLWEGWLSPCEGGITCVLTCSHDAVVDMKRHYRMWVRPEDGGLFNH